MRMIDADALLKQFPLPEDMRDPKQALKHITGIRAEIECAPTIEPKTGKWIKHSIGEHTPWGYDCSECGEWFVVGEEVIKKYNFCPNCGADMRGEER